MQSGRGNWNRRITSIILNYLREWRKRRLFDRDEKSSVQAEEYVPRAFRKSLATFLLSYKCIFVKTIAELIEASVLSHQSCLERISIFQSRNCKRISSRTTFPMISCQQSVIFPLNVRELIADTKLLFALCFFRFSTCAFLAFFHSFSARSTIRPTRKQLVASRCFLEVRRVLSGRTNFSHFDIKGWRLQREMRDTR